MATPAGSYRSVEARSAQKEPGARACRRYSCRPNVRDLLCRRERVSMDQMTGAGRAVGAHGRASPWRAAESTFDARSFIHARELTRCDVGRSVGTNAEGGERGNGASVLGGTDRVPGRLCCSGRPVSPVSLPPRRNRLAVARPFRALRYGSQHISLPAIIRSGPAISPVTSGKQIVEVGVCCLRA